MKILPIEALVTQVRGVSYAPEDLHKELDAESIVLLRANNIDDGKINFDDVVFVDKRKVSPAQLLQKGDILICTSSGSKNLVGKAAAIDFTKPATFGAFCKVVRPLNPEDADYLALFFQSPFYRRKISALAMGANINNIRNEHIASLPIQWPDEEKRRKAVAILTTISNMLRKRKEELQQLDVLVKSRFVEMFGDPETNHKHWTKCPISTVVKGKASNGFFAKREAYTEDGNVSVLGVTHVVNRMYSQINHLPRTNATAAETHKFSVKYGDMLFCRSSLVAAGIGKASIVPENTPNNVLFECHVIRLPLDLEKCVPEFIQVLSTTDFFRHQIIVHAKTATMTTIGQDGILNATIILPPLNLQKEFFEFVKQVASVRNRIQQYLSETQLLFESLMQKYFHE